MEQNGATACNCNSKQQVWAITSLWKFTVLSIPIYSLVSAGLHTKLWTHLLKSFLALAQLLASISLVEVKPHRQRRLSISRVGHLPGQAMLSCSWQSQASFDPEWRKMTQQSKRKLENMLLQFAVCCCWIMMKKFDAVSFIGATHWREHRKAHEKSQSKSLLYFLVLSVRGSFARRRAWRFEALGHPAPYAHDLPFTIAYL